MEEIPQDASKVVIPDQLKSILKEYAKSVIRTQPDDLLLWSANYFQTLVTEELKATTADEEAHV